MFRRKQTPIPEPLQKRSRKKRDLLLKSMRELLQTKDLGAISVSDLAAKAGTSVGTIYQRFGDRDGLIRELFRQYEEDRNSEFAEALNEELWRQKSLEETAEGLATTLVEHYWKHRGVLRAYIMHYRMNPEDADNVYYQGVGKLYATLTRPLLYHQKARNERAVRFAVFAVLACCRDLILFDNDPRQRSNSLERKRIAKEMAMLLLGYLQLAAPQPTYAVTRTFVS